MAGACCSTAPQAAVTGSRDAGASRRTQEAGRDRGADRAITSYPPPSCAPHLQRSISLCARPRTLTACHTDTRRSMHTSVPGGLLHRQSGHPNAPRPALRLALIHPHQSRLLRHPQRQHTTIPRGPGRVRNVLENELDVREALKRTNMAGLSWTRPTHH